MKWLALSSLIAITVPVAQMSPGKSSMDEGVALTYEHLANEIIEIRATEDALVGGILMHHQQRAMSSLEAAASASGGEQHALLESAAREIATLAEEGGKGVQAVRQRLLKAGHHHHTDAETKEDYIFIDGTEKKALLSLASRVPKLNDAAGIKAAAAELAQLYEKAVVPE